MVDLRLSFPDEFAPSSAQAYSSNPDAASNPSARHLFYNQHLYDFLGNAINEAIKLGLPPIDFGFPLTFAKVDKAALSRIYAIANGLSDFIPEGSASWLCIQLYIRYALVCNDLTEPIERKVQPLPGENPDSVKFRQKGLDTLLPISQAFFLGAAARELELAVLNKKDALRGKKTARSAKAGGEAKKAATGPDSQQRVEAMRSLVEAGQSVNNAARLTAIRVGGTPEANKALWKRRKK